MSALTSSNRLEDFDLCLAISQIAIDTQMQYAWNTWKRRTGFSDTINIFKVKRDGELVDSQYGLSATIAPLTVSLAVDNGKFGQVQVGLKILSGKVVYYDEALEGKAEYPVKDWTISFLTDLDTKPVDLNILKQIDPAAHDIAADVVANSGLPDSVFSIEYLFLKFTNVDLIVSDNKNIKIPADVPENARTRAMAALNQLLTGMMGDYIMGTVVRRNRAQATPNFALTDFIFSVTADFTVPKASTLNYLGEFSGRALPGNWAAARSKLAEPWLKPEQIDGRTSNVSGIMAIRRSPFLDRYLFPLIAEKLRSTLPNSNLIQSQDNLSWTFKQSCEDSQHWQDLVDNVASWKRGFELTFELQPSQGRIRVQGKTYAGFHLDQKTLWGSGGALYWGNIYFDGHSNIEGAIDFVGNGAGAKFNLEGKLTYKFSEPITDIDEIGGEQKFEDAFGFLYTVLGEKKPHDYVVDNQKSIANLMKTTLDQVMSQLSVRLSQHVFIPPGGGVFSFSSPRFSAAGDLYFDVIYTAP